MRGEDKARAALAEGRPALIWQTIVADTETPVGAALKLMEFLVSDEAQKIYAETNNEFPVKEGVEKSELVASWGEFTADDLPLSEISDLRPKALDLIEQINLDG